MSHAYVYLAVLALNILLFEKYKFQNINNLCVILTKFLKNQLHFNSNKLNKHSCKTYLTQRVTKTKQIHCQKLCNFGKRFNCKQKRRTRGGGGGIVGVV